VVLQDHTKAQLTATGERASCVEGESGNGSQMGSHVHLLDALQHRRLRWPATAGMAEADEWGGRSSALLIQINTGSLQASTLAVG
jgi:hypothetical protein